MKAHRVAFDAKSKNKQRNDPENHLPRCEHGWRKLERSSFDQNVCIGCTGGSNDNCHAAPESKRAIETEQTRADHSHAAERDDCAGKALETQRLVWQHPMRTEHSENWNCRLQYGSQTRRDVQLRPKKQRVVHREHENSGNREQYVILAP